jgi:hypothetical protein
MMRSEDNIDTSPNVFAANPVIHPTPATTAMSDADQTPLSTAALISK